MDDTSPLDRLMTLDRIKLAAFLALFGGARLKDRAVFRDGRDGGIRAPSFGKHECDRVEDWHDFYGRELPALGLTTFAETKPQPATGMAPGSTYWDITIGITANGQAARDAWYERPCLPRA